MKVFGEGEILKLAEDTRREKFPEHTTPQVLLKMLKEVAEVCLEAWSDDDCVTTESLMNHLHYYLKQN